MSNKKRFKLIGVNTAGDIKDFLRVASLINKDEKNYIRPLDEDIEKIFDRETNKRFRKGDAIRWILKDDEGKLAGRVAAFYDPATASKDDQLTGGCGFFDSINDQNAANILFDAAKNWLGENGMEAMDGPVNFGSRELFWGCLADGFYEPNYNMPYNPPYYNALFTDYGFLNYFNQYTYHVPLTAGNMDEIIYENGEYLKDNPDYQFDTLVPGKMDKYAEDFMIIFNEAWARFPGVRPFRKQQALTMFNKLKPIADKRAIIFAYYKNRPIAFFLMIPDLFEIIRKFNGKFNLINKLRLMLFVKIFRRNKRLIGQIFGVVPDFQGKGVAAGMILRFEKEVAKPGFHYTDLEMNWIGDFNPGMMKMVRQIGGKIRKTHITYRYLFDRNAEFKRAKKVS